jgi:DNA mismatch repair protein MutH
MDYQAAFAPPPPPNTEDHKPCGDSSKEYDALKGTFVTLSKRVFGAAADEALKAEFLHAATELCAHKVNTGRKPLSIGRLPLTVDDGVDKESTLKFRNKINRGLDISEEMERATDPERLCALQLEKLQLQSEITLD